MSLFSGLRAAILCLAGLAAGVTVPLLAAERVVAERVDVAPAWSGHPVGFSIETADDRQYVAFYDAQRRMTVAARTLGS